jgi:tRNA-dihydrouridine synthase
MGHGHDAHWKRMCIKVGARPERCYTPEIHGGDVKQLKGKYKLINKRNRKSL